MNLKNKKNNCVVEQPIKKFCEVCCESHKGANKKEQFQMLRCSRCQKFVHKNCYKPDFKKKEDKFTCDLCQSKKKQAYCSLCQQKEGIFKRCSGESQGKQAFIHVFCGLMSDRVRVISYSGLQMKIKSKKKQQSHENKSQIPQGKVELTIELKVETKSQTCFICKHRIKQNAKIIGKCSMEGCDKHAHINCLKNIKKDEQRQSQEWECCFELLEKNDFSIRNLRQLTTQMTMEDFPTLSPAIVQTNRYFICSDHPQQTQFIYCPCNKNKKSQFLGCDECGRWIHQVCSGIKGGGEYLKCKGCKQNDIFYKRMILPELINQIIKIQQTQKKNLTIDQIKIIDSFPFSLSSELLGKILQSKQTTFPHLIDTYLNYFNFTNPDIFKQESFCLNFIKETNFMEWLTKLLEKNVQEKKFDQKDILKNIQNCKIFSEKSKKIITQIMSFQLKYQKRKAVTVELIDKLKQIQKKFGNKNVENKSGLLQQIFEISKTYKEFINLNHVRQKKPITVLNLILEENLSIDQIKRLVEKYFFCKKYSQNLNDQMPQKQFYECKKFVYNFDKPARDKIIQLFEQLFIKIKPNRDFTYRQNFVENLNNQLQNGQLQIKKIKKIKQYACSHDIVIGEGKTYEKVEEDLMYLKLVKHKLMGITQKITLNNIEKIEKFFDILQKGKINIMTEDQKTTIKKKIVKYKFYKTITQKWQELKNDYLLENESSDKVQMANEQLENQHFIKYANIALQSPELKGVEFEFMQSQVYRLICNQIELSAMEIKSLKKFCSGIINEHQENHTQNLKRLEQQKVYQIVRIIHYLNLGEVYPLYQQEYEKYIQWKAPLQSFTQFETIFQNEEENLKLFEVAETLLIESENVKINITSEIKKIKTLRLWCNISFKYFQNFCLKKRKKPTIHSVMQFKDIIQCSKYPHNQNYNQIFKMYLEAQEFNKKIVKFFQKAKESEIDVIQQLKIYKNKLTIKEAEELLLKFKVSSLDLNAESEQLEVEIKQFHKIQPYDQQIAIKKDIKQLMTIRKKLFQNPIRPCSEELYYELICKIYSQKAQNCEWPLSRKDFNRIANYGGLSFLSFIQTQKGLKAYKFFKTIQKAEKELMLNSEKNQKNLIQMCDQKRLTEDIDIQESDRKNVIKLFQKSKKIRDNFINLKIKISDENQFNFLVDQIGRLPINMKDITDQIASMKKEISIIQQRIKLETSQNRLISRFNEQYIQNYRQIGMRRHSLDCYIQQLEGYKKICQMAEMQSIQNYKQFSLECQKQIKLSRLQKICKIRYNYLKSMHVHVKNNKDISIQLCRTIIQEGCDLIKSSQSNTEKDQLLTILLQMNKLLQQSCSESIDDDAEDDEIIQNPYVQDYEMSNEDNSFQSQHILQEPNQQSDVVQIEERNPNNN